MAKFEEGRCCPCGISLLLSRTTKHPALQIFDDLPATPMEAGGSYRLAVSGSYDRM